MTTAVLLAGAILTLPERPVLDEVEAGRRIGRSVVRNDAEVRLGLPGGSGRQGELRHVYEPFQKPLGWWSDGGRKVAVEWGLELTPELVSRWLGYLEERELWEERELGRRWEAVRERMGQQRVFVVVLSAFPTQPRLGIGEERPQSDIETKQVIFTLESSMGRTEPNAVMFHNRQTRTRSEIEAVPWWTLTPFEGELTSVFQPAYERPVIERGHYYRTFWLVWSETDLGAGEVTLKIASQRKVRSAMF